MARTEKRSARRTKENSGEVWARILSQKSKYYISQTELRDETCRIDDEAQLEIVAMIDAITPALRKHLGGELTVSLLAAEQYAPQAATAGRFFGSVNMRGSQRSALAYLPSQPFWALPALIAGGASYVCIGWNCMRQGYAELSSLFVGDAEDRAYLLERLARP